MSCRILIAAGGTGGHIYPALALGQALRAAHSDVEVDFLCGQRDLELRLYRAAGENPIVQPARHSGGRLLGWAVAGTAAAANLSRSFLLMRRMGVRTVVGMGGYVSGPAVLAGKIAGCRTVVHEANSVPGRTNRWLAPYADLLAVHFDATLRLVAHKNGVRTGMPLRADIATGSREAGRTAFNLAPDRTTLLVIGGSQGARYLYRKIAEALPLLDADPGGGLQILWSTGEQNFEELQAAVTALNLMSLSVRLVPFISNMPDALAAADCAVARAGAGTLAELLACGVEPLFVPFAAAVHDHQTRNAMAAVEAGAGSWIPEKELTPQLFASSVRDMVKRAAGGRRMAVPPELDSRPAAQTLARLVYDLSEST